MAVVEVFVVVAVEYSAAVLAVEHVVVAVHAALVVGTAAAAAGVDESPPVDPAVVSELWDRDVEYAPRIDHGFFFQSRRAF